MQAVAVLTKNTNPTDTEIDGVMAGNLCLCGTYTEMQGAHDANVSKFDNVIGKIEKFLDSLSEL